MDVQIAGTARPASWLVPEIVPPLNSPTARRTDYDTTGPRDRPLRHRKNSLRENVYTFFKYLGNSLMECADHQLKGGHAPLMIIISFVSPFHAFIIHKNTRTTTDNHFPHRSIKRNKK